MGEDGTIDYPALLRAALRSVLRSALEIAAEQGAFPGEHHLFVRFRTDADGVLLPPRLKGQYPEEMTVILQHQFWDLAVSPEAFAVTLRFGGAPEHIVVPFAAVTAFADPSAEFGLEIGAPPVEADRPGPRAVPEPEGCATADDAEVATEPEPDDTPPGGGKVLHIDRFRKS